MEASRQPDPNACIYLFMFLTLLPQRGTDPGCDPELLCAQVVNVCMGDTGKKVSSGYVENRKWKIWSHKTDICTTGGRASINLVDVNKTLLRVIDGQDGSYGLYEMFSVICKKW
jgi:hypothetical protein